MKTINETMEMKLHFAASIMAVIANTEPGAPAINRELIENIAMAGRAANFLLEQAIEEMEG